MSNAAAVAPPAYTIAVRALCDFTARQGDLDLRFTPSPTAQEGMAGHALVATRRGAGYQTELPLEGRFEAGGQTLHVRGRADGFDARRPCLEEIKTHRGALDQQPDNHRHLHWAQARVYGHLLCAQQGLAQLEIALVYLDVGTERETVLAETWSADELRTHFEDQCRRFLAWATQEATHRQTRDQALATLRFPHADFRTGQRPLAEAVYKAATHRRCLLAQAPTGIGKTIGTLFPLLKACPSQGIDKLFYLSAKTSGRQLALDALQQLHPTPTPAPWRVLELVARDKACEHPDKACHGESCPLAQGFYNRLPQARQAAIDAGQALDKAQVRAVASAHGVCPYYLGQELARWADIVVGDYNHYFDLHAMLHSLTQAQQWRAAALVDEAHNLLDRARGMYSAELSQHALRSLRRTAPAPLKRPLERVHRLWQSLVKVQTADYQPHDEPPFALVQALQHLVGAITDHLTEHPAAATDTALQGFYFDALHFTRVAELFDEHSMFDVHKQAPPPGSRGKPNTVLCLRNLVPAPFLAPRWAGLHTATLFSATVQPWNYQLDTLGLPDNTACIDLPSPFDARQLQVDVATRLSTRYKDREASLQPMATLMASHYQARPGNYLAFFSSFDYLRQAADHFEALNPTIPTWRQSRGMSEGEQSSFLARFTEHGQGIGFAVLGGAFAEGVDLPGRRLVGAFIATLGLPQFNPVNEEICHRLQRLFGARLGHDYTYLYPGLQKVVQAAGRVIRTPQDEGVVVLMDERFAQARVRELLPTWWAAPAGL
ncbi:ATP-dependent DNA helicase [Aquabacterium soli]|uniref:ATP-dependent DNA helicase n=1 Tax=Aquabacterium soli TaxID=2493092 RepID=A0A3R8YPM1_9BURK|nr:ATP-dependent DNA helicase [Aquabacterium soli]RRS05116.1 ATP-dependent DNA helicase [Aquabacterium soli]